MLWVSTKSMSHGRKKVWAMVGENCWRCILIREHVSNLWLRKALKPAVKPFSPFLSKDGFDLERVWFQAALKVCRQNCQTSALDGPAQWKERVTSQPPRTFHLSLKSHSRIKEQENLGNALQFWVKNVVLELKKKKKVPLNLFPSWGSFPFLPHPHLVYYLGPCRRAGLWSGCLREGNWGAVPCLLLCTKTP